MSGNSAVLIRGMPGSPYTRKMLAVLRYRRIPYRFILGRLGAHQGLPAAKVELLPTVYFPVHTANSMQWSTRHWQPTSQAAGNMK